jgi:hypothetical protein
VRVRVTLRLASTPDSHNLECQIPVGLRCRYSNPPPHGLAQMIAYTCHTMWGGGQNDLPARKPLLRQHPADLHSFRISLYLLPLEDYNLMSFKDFFENRCPSPDCQAFQLLPRKHLHSRLRGNVGRAIPQAVSRWLSTAAARVRSRVWSSRVCGRQSGAGAGFLRVLRFPLPIFIPPIAPQSPSPII